MPRDAATLILIDQRAGEPRVLMGRRHADLVFLANKYVFPGGRVDPADLTAPSADHLSEIDMHKLLADMRGAPSRDRARALALAAIRETYEEAGVLLGVPAATTPEGEGPWQAILAHGQLPAPGALRYFARAITPPGRPRRYDTRFFLADASAISLRLAGGDGELLDLDWFTLAKIRALDLPGITRLIVEDIACHLATAVSPDIAPVPFYFHEQGRFQRTLIHPKPV